MDFVFKVLELCYAFSGMNLLIARSEDFSRGDLKIFIVNRFNAFDI